MGRYDLTDKEWAAIEPVLPTDVRGKERVDDRRGRVVSGLPTQRITARDRFSAQTNPDASAS